MTLGSHQRSVGKSQTYITPRRILDALGEFDLDPCAASPRPWDCAVKNIALPEDGLVAEWFGRVWLNPPFDRYQVGAWVSKLAMHGNGVALLHARVETDWFRHVWRAADAILFLDGRLKFCREDGSEHVANSGAPVVLAAFGEGNANTFRMRGSSLSGYLITSWRVPLTADDVI